jgi:hypothetical protein
MSDTPEPSRLENAQAAHHALSVVYSAAWTKWAVENIELICSLEVAKAELEAAERESVGKA